MEVDYEGEGEWNSTGQCKIGRGFRNSFIIQLVITIVVATAAAATGQTKSHCTLTYQTHLISFV